MLTGRRDLNVGCRISLAPERADRFGRLIRDISDDVTDLWRVAGGFTVMMGRYCDPMGDLPLNAVCGTRCE
jgi:hypothetical protein